jgi:outer membrane protein insertion porin family
MLGARLSICRIILCSSTLALLCTGLSSEVSAQFPPGPAGPVPLPKGFKAEASAEPIQQGKIVKEIRITGNQVVPAQKIRTKLNMIPGKPIDQFKITEDVRSLIRSGDFIDVKPSFKDTPEGIILTYRVIERPVLAEITFHGNSNIKTKKLLEESGLKEGDPLDLSLIADARARIEGFYQGKGYNHARVDILEGNSPKHRRAVFNIYEGPKQVVRSISFVGNTIVNAGRLDTVIETSKPTLYFIGGEFQSEKLESDIGRLEAYYHSLGYWDVRVGREVTFSDDQSDVYIKFIVNEGVRYKVRNISFVGNRRIESENLALLTKLKSGDDFKQTTMQADIRNIKDQYGSKGYVFANVKPDIRFLEQPGELDLVYELEEGARYRVGRVIVDINGDSTHTKIATVLNRISLNPGDIVDVSKLRDSERRIKASGLFRNDPSRGVSPTLTVRPAEEDFSIAERRTLKTRAQSPAQYQPKGQPVQHTGYKPPVGDMVMDITLSGELVPAQESGAPSLQSAPVHQLNPHQVTRERGLNLQWSQPRASETSPQASPAPAYSSQPLIQPAKDSTTRRSYQTRGQSPYDNRSVAGADPLSRTNTSPVNRNGSTFAPQNTAPVTPGYGAPAVGNTGQFIEPQGQGVAQTQFNGPALTPANPGQQNYLPSPADDSIFTYQDDYTYTDPRINVYASVEETETGRLMFGAGVNSDAGLVGNIMIDEQNFDWKRIPTSWSDLTSGNAWRGGGQRFRLEVVPGTEVSRYSVLLQEPYLFNRNVSLGLNASYYDRRFTHWDEQRTEGRISTGYAFTPDLSGTFAFRGANIKILDPRVPTPADLADAVGTNSLYGFRFGLTFDTRDSAFMATEGHLIDFGFEQVVGTYDYPRFTLDMKKYFLITERADESGRQTLTLSTKLGFTGDDTPIYDRFYAGGFSTIRGFDFRGVGPRDGGVEIGGDFQFLGSIEYLFPITQDDMLRAVAFCDFGTVESTTKIGKMRVAPGFGLRVTIPAMGPAPIALDFAFPVSKEDFDEERVFSFFVGLNR